MQQLDARSAAWIVFVVIASTATLYLPSISIQQAQNGAWLSPVLAVPFGFLTYGLIRALCRRHPGQSFTAIALAVFGPVIGRVIVILMAAFLWQAGVIILRQLLGFVKTFILLESPILAVDFILSLAIWLALRYRVTVLGKVNQMVGFTLAALLAILLISTKPDVHMSAFTPWLESGWKGVVRGAIVPATWYSQIVLLIFVWHEMKPDETALLDRKMLWTLLWTTLFLVIVNIAVLGVLGVQESARSGFPTLEIARYVQLGIGGQVQRLDILFIIPWILATIFKIIFFYYGACAIIRDLLHHTTFDAFSSAIVFSGMGVALVVFPKASIASYFISYDWPAYGLMFEIGVPLLFVISSLVRSRLKSWLSHAGGSS
ncbi:MAG: GerAB/ArcD/ProY family transporter [Bacilli bacterium]